MTTARLIKFPSEEDWTFCKKCALVTVGKTVITPPGKEWKHKMLEARHSPIRTLQFAFELDIPYWISVHLVRHIHAQPFVKSQRNDRQNDYDRTKAPQDELVKMIWYMNAEELMTIANKRLCQKASKETRQAVQAMCDNVVEVCPEFDGLLVPTCQYNGGICHEIFPCNTKST